MVEVINERLNVGDIVKHFEGKKYQISAFITHEDKVMCRSLESGEYFMEPRDTFISKLDKAKHPDVEQEYKYELLLSSKEIKYVMHL